METPLTVAVICQVPHLIESAKNLLCKKPRKKEAAVSQEGPKRMRTWPSQDKTRSQFAPTTPMMKGLVLRCAVLAANLLLNAGTAAPGAKFMWILPTATQSGGATHWVEPVTAKGSIAAAQQNVQNDDSTWWLTHHLLSTISPEQKQRSASRKKNQPKKRHTYGEQWALTRALIPRKYQKSPGGKPPVPGKLPSWST